MSANQFIISVDSCTIGFHEHVTLNILVPVEEQLNRRALYSRQCPIKSDPFAIKKVIEQNSSLRIGFGWSFESSAMFKQMMHECIEVVGSRYTKYNPTMISDSRCDWLGFLPFNVFEKEIYTDLTIYGLLEFNNEIVDYQTDVVKFIAQHPLFLAHSLMRNQYYRFQYYKSKRHNPVDLTDAFHYYMQCARSTTNLNVVPRSVIEEDIGCHYLRHPDTFFEMLELYTLKGNIL